MVNIDIGGVLLVDSDESVFKLLGSNISLTNISKIRSNNPSTDRRKYKRIKKEIQEHKKSELSPWC